MKKATFDNADRVTAFYDTGINKTIPDEAESLTDEQFFILSQNQTTKRFNRETKTIYDYIAPFDLDAAKNLKSIELETDCKTAIEAGLVVNGREYPTKILDQQNLTSVCAAANSFADTMVYTFWCGNVSTGEWDFIDHSAAEILAVGKAVIEHVFLCKKNYANALKALALATNQTEIDAVSL